MTDPFEVRGLYLILLLQHGSLLLSGILSPSHKEVVTKNTRESGVSLKDARLCETIRPRQREVQHEIPSCNVGGRGLSRCEWVGGLFLSEKQGPSDRTDGVHSCSANLPHCDCRLTLSR